MEELFEMLKELLSYTCGMCPDHTQCKVCPVNDIRQRVVEMKAKQSKERLE